MKGVIRTRAGYAGGTIENPTYRSIGDATETLQVDYDPAKISYSDLLDIYWNSHNPTARSWSTQYRSVIFYSDEEQRKAAEKSAARVEKEIGRKLSTAIEPLRKFTLAEDYHQKYYLRQEGRVMADFAALYPDQADFRESPAAAKANGFVSGMGSEKELKELLPQLGLSEEGEKQLLRRVR